MTLGRKVQESIAEQVIKILVSRFASFPEEGTLNRNAPFHEAFLSAFAIRLGPLQNDSAKLISMSSWLHGLNTSLGQSFFEKVANSISGGEKKEWTSGRLGNLYIYQSQQDAITDIITDLSNSSRIPSLADENTILLRNRNGKMLKASDFSADVCIEHEDMVIGIEMKSVKPNSGEMRGEKRKILEAKAALRAKYHKKEVSFYIGFPFDPTVEIGEGENSCSYDKIRFMSSIIGCNKFFAPEEILLGSELWDFLSGEENTMQDVLEIINRIARPEFMEDFNLLLNNDPNQEENQKRILNAWYQFSELELIDKKAALVSKTKSDRRLSNRLRQACFSPKGEYKRDRYAELIGLV